MGPNLQGKVVSAPPGRECTPEAEQESIFRNWEICHGLESHTFVLYHVPDIFTSSPSLTTSRSSLIVTRISVWVEK